MSECEAHLKCRLFAATLSSLNYDANKLPLGKLWIPVCGTCADTHTEYMRRQAGQVDDPQRVLGPQGALRGHQPARRRRLEAERRVPPGRRAPHEPLLLVSLPFPPYLPPCPIPPILPYCQSTHAHAHRIIPHVFGRDRPTIIDTLELLKRELELVDALGDMEIATQLLSSALPKDPLGNPVNPLDANFRSLGLSSMEPVARASREWGAL